MGVRSATELAIGGTEVQGMMMGCYEPGTKLDLGRGNYAVNLDGDVWEIQDERENVLATVNPTVLPCGCDVIEKLEHAITGCRIDYNSVRTFE